MLPISCGLPCLSIRQMRKIAAPAALPVGRWAGSLLCILPFVRCSGSTALDVVTAPFEAMRDIYDFVGSALAPYGLELDYARIEAARPVIAEMLR